jgi:drug/metabolite transporter (DMT)-like permease
MTKIVKIFLASGLMLMILSAFFYALTDVLVKFMFTSLGVIQIGFFRFVLGGLILWPLLVSGRYSLKGKYTRVLIVRGLVGTLTFLCFLKSIAMIPLSNAIVLIYTFPLFATFFSFLLLKEPFKKLEIMLTVVSMIGIYILINASSYVFNMGHIFGLLTGCFAGLSMVLIRKLRKTNDPLIIYFYFCMVGGTVLFPFFIVSFKIPDFEQFSLLVLLAVIFLIGQILMNQGFKYCKASEGSVILMSEVVFTGIAGVVIFNDSLSPIFLAGASLIVGSGVGLNLINHRSRFSDALSHP